MENASKALLIAGGMLILIVLVSIILLVKANVENYYASENELEMIADTTKFNEQFTRFNRNDVQGYELISLVNKVVDYNERLSEASATGNDSQAKPIQLTISLVSEAEIKNKFAYDKDLGTFLFRNINLVVKENLQKAINYKTATELSKIVSEIESMERSSKNISILAKKISNIVLDSNYLNRYCKPSVNADGKVSWSWEPSSGSSINSEQQKKDITKMYSAILEYQRAVGNNTKYAVSKWAVENYQYSTVTEQYKKMIDENATNMYKYYEYVQFKKAVFKCTKLNYDASTGKVNELRFEFTGKIE